MAATGSVEIDPLIVGAPPVLAGIVGKRDRLAIVGRVVAVGAGSTVTVGTS
jgi:hypothetical protein